MISDTERYYFGEEPKEKEPMHVFLGRRLLRYAEAETDDDKRMTLYFASGYVAATGLKRDG